MLNIIELETPKPILHWEYVKGIGGVTGIGHVTKAGKGQVFLKDKNSIKLLTIAGYDHFRS